MANNCFYMMHIKGDKNAIEEFVGMMKDGKMGRFFSVETEMDSDHEAIVSGDCAWSLSSAVLLSGTNRLEEPAFLNKMRRLGLSIEAYTADAPASYGLLSNVRGMRLSDFLEQSTDCSFGVDTLLLTTDQGKAVSVVEECHGAIRADGTEKVTEIEFRQLKPFVAYKTAQLLQNGGLDAAELDSLAANIFMDMDWLQMCTDLAEQMAWECSTERSELAEVLWNGDPEQGIAALADIAVDDDDCIKQEWMGYKPGTPRFEVWKDFETNFSKDGVSLCELSGFDDYKVEYKDPGPTLSKSEFDKLFGLDVREENVQKDVSDVSLDDPSSEDER